MRPRQVSDDVLLGKALTAFAEDGYDGASMRALCRRLEVSHNMLHERFGSKEALWYAAVDHGFRGLVAELGDAVMTAGDDPLEQLRAAMLRFVSVTRVTPALIEVLHQEAARGGPRYEHLFTHYVAPINEVGLRSLRQLQTEGRVRPGPVATTFFHLTTYGLGAMSSHPESFAALGDVGADPEHAAALGVDMILQGLRPPSQGL